MIENKLKYQTVREHFRSYTSSFAPHLFLVVGGDGVVGLAERHGDEIDHLSEERPLHVHLSQLLLDLAVTLW